MRNIISYIATLLASYSLFSQEVSSTVFSTAGNQGNSADIYVSYTIGQPLIILNNNGAVVTDGFQQGYRNAEDTIGISFMLQSNSMICYGDTAHYSASSGKVVKHLSWHFEGGNPASVSQNFTPSITYTTLGTFKTSLEAQYADNTEGEITINNIISVIGIVQRYPTIDKGDSILLSVNDTTLEYVWSNGATTAKTYVKPSESAHYIVTVTNPQTAISYIDSTIISVKQPIDTDTIKYITLEKTDYTFADSIDLKKYLPDENSQELLELANITWYNTSNENILIKNIDYNETNGEISFSNDFSDSIYCIIDFSDSLEYIMKTNNIYVCGAIPEFYIESVCNNDIVSNFHNTSQFTSSYFWTFGNGITRTDENPTHTFINTTDSILEYSISLEVASSSGCKRKKDTTIYIYQNPDVSFELENSTPFINENLVFTNTTNTYFFQDSIFEWIHGGSRIHDTYESHTAKFTTTGDQNISLSVVLKNGCKNIGTQTYTIKDIPDFSLSQKGNIELCEGDSLLVFINNYEYFNIEWYKGNDLLISEKNDSLIIKQSGNYFAKLIGTGGTWNTDTVHIDFISVPSAYIQIKNTEHHKICTGDTALLTTDVRDTSSIIIWLKELDTLAINTKTIYVLDAGIYSMHLQKGGCIKKSEPATIQVITMPKKPTIATPDNYEENQCMGNVISLHVENKEDFAYQWYKNDKPMKGETESSISGILNATDYYVVCKNDICENKSEPLTIQYKPNSQEKPRIEYLGPDYWYLACNVDDADEYKWYVNDIEIVGENKYYYEAGKKEKGYGKYQVAINSGFECFTYSDPIRIPEDTEFNSTTNIQIEQQDENTINLYPNPSDGIFTIGLNSEFFGLVDIEVINSLGITIYKKSITKNNTMLSHHIHLQDIPNGTYTICINCNNFVMEKLFIVNQ